MFDDYDGPQLHFINSNGESQSSNQENNYTSKDNIEKSEIGINTIKPETIEESTQLNIKDLMQNEKIKNYDEKKLESFLLNAYELINDALLLRKDERLDLLDDNNLNELSFTYKSLLKFPSLKSDEQKYQISDMIWNKNGSVLGVSFFIDDNHIGPCPHTGNIIFFKFDDLSSFNNNNESKILKSYSSKIELETNSCIKCIDSHPSISNLFVAGSYNGEIYLINLGLYESGKDIIEFSSTIDSTFYKECVISVKFVKYEDNIYYIVSISEDGRILVWNPIDKLKYPVIGFNLKFKIDKTTLPINPTYFINNPFESFDFLIGTYDGNIYKSSFNKPNSESGSHQDYLFLEKNGVVWRQKVRTFISNMKEKELTEMKNLIEKICLDRGIINLDMEEFLTCRPDVTKIYKNALKSNFEKHFSFVTSISQNLFIRNLFITTSYDGSLRLYHGDNKGTKFFYSQMCENNDPHNKDNFIYYTCSTWSPYKPSLFSYGKSNGEISFDVITSKNTVKNVLKMNSNGYQCSVVKIVYNPNESELNNIIAVGYNDGIVELIQLSDSFSKVGNSEIETLLKITSK